MGFWASKMLSDKEVGDKKPSSAKVLASNNGYKKAPKQSIVNMLEQGGCEQVVQDDSRQHEHEEKKEKMPKSMSDSKSRKKALQEPQISDLSNAISSYSRASVSIGEKIIEEEKEEHLCIDGMPPEVELSGQPNSPHSSDKQMKIPYSGGSIRSASRPSDFDSSLVSQPEPNKILDKRLYDNSPRPNLINVIESSQGDIPDWIEMDITDETDECIEIKSVVPMQKVQFNELLVGSQRSRSQREVEVAFINNMSNRRRLPEKLLQQQLETSQQQYSRMLARKANQSKLINMKEQK